MNKSVRIVFIVVGVIAALIGGVFAGQGAGLIPGSFMTGDRTWLVIGTIVGFVGVILIIIGAGRSRTGADDR